MQSRNVKVGKNERKGGEMGGGSSLSCKNESGYLFLDEGLFAQTAEWTANTLPEDHKRE